VRRVGSFMRLMAGSFLQGCGFVIRLS